MDLGDSTAADRARLEQIEDEGRTFEVTFTAIVGANDRVSAVEEARIMIGQRYFEADRVVEVDV